MIFSSLRPRTRIAGSVSVLLLTLAVFTPSPGHAAPAAAERTSVKVLTIGNSFADYATTFLPDLARAGGKTLVIAKANPGGCSLERHARYLAQAEAGDPAGRAYTAFVDPVTGKTRAVTLPEALAAAPWDIVTLQQWSQQSYRPETYHPHVDQLIAAIHRYAPRAEILIHETWSYREDHPAFQKQDGFTPDKMYAGLRAAYRQLAGETGFRIIPSGDAFQLARQTSRWTFAVDRNFDFKNPPAGQLPDQRTSLNAGWQWTKDKAGKPALTLDAIHLNTAGRYLGAAVWYQVLFNASTVPAGFTPPDLSAEDAAGLREHAAAAVRDQRSREVALPAR
ncbi:MAG TPA: DUF4886 domain-containing protein [Rariglobus sp.]|nr:DUF4886 domain-containing protein [Rariglobus sp.]